MLSSTLNLGAIGNCVGRGWRGRAGHPRGGRLLLAAVLAPVVTLAPTAVGGALPALVGQGGTPTLAPLLKKVTPAVVNISVRTRTPETMNPLFRDPFFRRFFNVPENRARPEQSAGSGVIVDAINGYVLTNQHVIEGADEIVVTLKDRRQVKAKLLGGDEGTDIALLQIPADGLTELTFGDSDALEVGDFVIAIGNPFGLGQTVTSGIVSALGRTGINVEGYEDFIQTDASINPGNSGGALVNLHGELIGINTAIVGPAGGNVGIGFAVPSAMAGAVMKQIATYGEVRRGRLGIAIQNLTPELAEALSLATRRGAIVGQVESGSPAEAAGIQAGDVVVEVEGHPISGSIDLRNRVALVRAGDQVKLTILREGTPIAIEAVVADLAAADAVQSRTDSRFAGATMRDLAPADPHHGEVEGVLVSEVEESSPAWNNGLRVGDVIIAINRQPTHTLDKFVDVLSRSARLLALAVLRGTGSILLVIR